MRGRPPGDHENHPEPIKKQKRAVSKRGEIAPPSPVRLGSEHKPAHDTTRGAGFSVHGLEKSRAPCTLGI